MALLERTKQLLPRLAFAPDAAGGAHLLDAAEDEAPVGELVIDAVLGHVTGALRDFTAAFAGAPGTRLMAGLLDVARTALQCRRPGQSAAQVCAALLDHVRRQRSEQALATHVQNKA